MNIKKGDQGLPVVASNASGDPRWLSTPSNPILRERDGKVNPREQFSERDGIAFAKDKYYAKLIDSIEKAKEGGYIRVGAVRQGSALNKVGLPATGLYFDVSKIRSELSKHEDHISKDVLKEIPEILRNPVVLAEDAKTGDVNAFGNVFAGHSPVLVGIVITHGRSNTNVINKVRTIHARRDFMTKITDESVLYLDPDKKRTRDWFQARDNVVPLGGTKFGFIRSIADFSGEVNTQEQFSERDYRYDTLINKPDMKLVRLDDTQSPDKKTILDRAIVNAKDVGRVDAYGNVRVYVTDANREVIVSKAAIRHGIDRRVGKQAPVLFQIGNILKNAIVVNEMDAKIPNADRSYILLGVGESNDARYYTRIIVNRFSNEVESVDVLYALHTKTESAVLKTRASSGNTTLQSLTDSKIKNSRFVEHCQGPF